MEVISRIACLLGMIVALEGCSAVVAFTQYAERTEHRSIEIGSTRKAIEAKFGDPVSIDTRDDGSVVATYQETLTDHSEFWNTPPWLRAIQYVLHDLFTLGITEFVYAPMEVGGKIYRAANTTEYRITVFYDVPGRVVDYSRARAHPKSPS